MSVRTCESHRFDRRHAVATARRLGETMLALPGLALVVAVIVTVRTFAFGYFQGDHALHEIARVLFG